MSETALAICSKLINHRRACRKCTIAALDPRADDPRRCFEGVTIGHRYLAQLRVERKRERRLAQLREPITAFWLAVGLAVIVALAYELLRPADFSCASDEECMEFCLPDDDECDGGPQSERVKLWIV